jgi:lysophospholipase L1-like esterase
MKIPALSALSALAASLAFAALAVAATDQTAYRFQFGADTAAPGYTLVAPTAAYATTPGYGFEPGAKVSTVSQPGGDPLHAGAVTAAGPFMFSVAVPEGNYRVTVTLGDPKAETNETVKAESRRLMVENVHLAAGQFETRTFTVNVRGPKISTGGEVNLDSREMDLATHVALSRAWDDKLTLAFSGAHPAVAAIEVTPAPDAITVFVCGDSTVTDQPSGGSWGQMFPRWFKPEVAVANHAESGETMRGFLKERRWDKILDTLKAGDYVIIEFGTNDSKSRGPQNIYPNQDFSETYAPADGLYRDLLKQFVADVRKKNAFPIIASPSARRGETNPAAGSLHAYAEAAMATAKELGVPGINLNAMGIELNNALGADATRQFADGTHHAEYGAYLQAKCIVLGIQQANLPLAKSIVDDYGAFDPKKPTPLPGAFSLPNDAGGRGAGGGGRRGGPAPAAVAPAAP